MNLAVRELDLVLFLLPVFQRFLKGLSELLVPLSHFLHGFLYGGFWLSSSLRSDVDCGASSERVGYVVASHFDHFIFEESFL